MTIIDTHAHLDHIEDLPQALENAKKDGVKAIMAVSMDLESCRKNLEIKQAEQDINILLAMGTHPSEAGKFDLDESLNLIRENKEHLTAIGEIGLDFWYKWVRKDKEKKDEQRLYYRKHLELTKELDLPAIIHTRGTWREALETVLELEIKKAVFHWYSGPIDVLDDILKNGYLISTTPSLVYSPEVQAAIEHAPIEHVMIETDTPVYFRNRATNEGFQAEPRDVIRTLKAYCEFKKMDEAEALEIFNNNAKQFFNCDF